LPTLSCRYMPPPYKPAVLWGNECHTGCSAEIVDLVAFKACEVTFTFDGNRTEIFSWLNTEYSFTAQSCQSICGCLNRACQYAGIGDICHPVQEGDCDTSPIVFPLDGPGPIRMGPGPVTFDINANGASDELTWVGAGTAFLAHDLNGNGIIDDGSELFGTATPGSQGVNGYVALSQLDLDGDGWVTAAEAPDLLIWNDANKDGVTNPGELHSAWEYLSQVGVNFFDGHRVDRFGNQYAWRSWAYDTRGRMIPTVDILFRRLAP
jgi:hypothetical protein